MEINSSTFTNVHTVYSQRSLDASIIKTLAAFPPIEGYDVHRAD